MDTRKSLASVIGYRARRYWLRTGARLRSVAMLIMYGALGLAGLALWVLMQLPMSARWKEMTVYAMAGCLGLFAMGWQMLRPQRAALR